MYSFKSSDRAHKESVAILRSNGRLQLSFSYGGKRHYITTGYPDTAENRRLAEIKAMAFSRIMRHSNNNAYTSYADFHW